MNPEADDKATATDATAQSETASKPTIDTLLADWEASKASESASSTTTEDRLAAVEGELTNRIIADEIVPLIKGELDIPDKIVKGYLAESAAENPKLNELFQNRKASPKEFQAALESVRDEFQKDMGGKKSASKSDDTNTDDDKGLAAAAALAKETKASDGFDDIDWDSMSDTQFELRKGALLRAAEAGTLK